MKHSLLATLLTTSLTALLSACVVGPAPYQYRSDVVYSDDVPSPVVTYGDPPPPQTEVIGVAPAPGYFWISGVWIWENDRYTWRHGYWSAPRPGYVWVPHRWRRAGREWHMDGGHWMRR